MLRLLNLLQWPTPKLPKILFGPLYESILYFDAHSVPPYNAPLVYNFGKPETSSLIRLVVWRVNMLVYLIDQAGILTQYFPVADRRGVLSRLVTCLDSMYPLLDFLEENTDMTVNEIYVKKLAPENRRDFVVDYSCTYFLRYLFPYVFKAVDHVPPILLDILGCKDDSVQLAKLLLILRHLSFDACHLRGSASIILNILRGNESDDWLISLLVTVTKYALLGNFPGSDSLARFPVRRQIYKLDRESILIFFTSCVKLRGNERVLEQGVIHAILSAMFIGPFHQKSIDYAHLDNIVKTCQPFLCLNQRVLKLVTNFYPDATLSNLISDVYRFSQPLQCYYKNIFLALNAELSLVTKNQSWCHIDFIVPDLERLEFPLIQIILNCPDEAFCAYLKELQRYFDTHGVLIPFLNTGLSSWWNNLGSLAQYIVERSSFAVFPASHALYFEQASRLLKLTGNLSTEKTTVLYCNSCSTVRFRPVGIYLPSSHITLLADLNFSRLHCVDCDSLDLCRINLLGRYVRCFLTTKKNRELVTLALCSACLHVSVCGFYASKYGVICSECMSTVKTRNSNDFAKTCISCSILILRPSPECFWTVLTDQRVLETCMWCPKCIPKQFSAFYNNKHVESLYYKKTLLLLSKQNKSRAQSRFETEANFKENLKH